MKNNHHFPSVEEEEKALIYKYIPVFTSMDFYFIQNYYFDWQPTQEKQTNNVELA